MSEWSREAVYRAEIEPLLRAAVQLCGKHRVPIMIVVQPSGAFCDSMGGTTNDASDLFLKLRDTARNHAEHVVDLQGAPQ